MDGMVEMVEIDGMQIINYNCVFGSEFSWNYEIMNIIVKLLICQMSIYS